VSNAVDSSGSMGVSAVIVAPGNGAGVGQSTSLSGKSGSVSFSASSPNNQMAVAGGFSGNGNMNADLSAVASDRAAMSGSASIVGVPVLDDDNIQQVTSGDVGMSVDGLYALPSGDLGKFGPATANVEKASASGTPSYLTGPAYTSSGGNLAGEGLTAAAVANAVSGATATCNAATNKIPFDKVTTSSTVKTDTYDHNNVVAFKYLSDAPAALAYSRTWYNYNKVGGYYSAIESDLSLNTGYRWSTTLPDGRPYFYSDPIDVQTVVTHGLGHTLGLGDLYTLPSTDSRKSDYKQEMNAYNDVQRTIGNGDKTGAWVLYG
jgi:hypothetical protein